MPHLGFTSKPAVSQEGVIRASEDPEVLPRVHGGRTTGLTWRQMRLPARGLLRLAYVDGDVTKRSVPQGGFAQSPLSLGPSPGDCRTAWNWPVVCRCRRKRKMPLSPPSPPPSPAPPPPHFRVIFLSHPARRRSESSARLVATNRLAY